MIPVLFKNYLYVCTLLQFQNIYYIPKIGNSHPKGRLYYFVHNYARRIAKVSDTGGSSNGAMETISETEEQTEQLNECASGNAFASYTLSYPKFYHSFKIFCISVSKN